MDDLVSRQKVLRCIKESRENIDWGQSEDGDAFLHYSGALYRTIASKECLPSAQQWIPCSEWLPEYGESVLCYFGTDEDFGVNHIIDEEDGEWFIDGVTAWMPLPEPYKEESDG